MNLIDPRSVESKDLHDTLAAIQAELRERANPAPRTVVSDNAMVKISGKRFRCEFCQVAIFTHYEGSQFECHGCQTMYYGEPTDTPAANGG